MMSWQKVAPRRAALAVGQVVVDGGHAVEQCGQLSQGDRLAMALKVTRERDHAAVHVDPQLIGGSFSCRPR